MSKIVITESQAIDGDSDDPKNSHENLDDNTNSMLQWKQDLNCSISKIFFILQPRPCRHPSTCLDTEKISQS